MTCGTWAIAHGIEIAGVAELRSDRLNEAGRQLNVPDYFRFSIEHA